MAQTILISAAAGPLAASTDTGTALAAATDFVYRWAGVQVNGLYTTVNHVLVQNNTTSYLNWEIDAAATPGSPQLAAGATLVLDVSMVALHLYVASGTPAVNGTTGGNIVVRGWL